eukprot:m.75238 g.75238  ORF g.75238 m.75238 type:complete len:273 (+) comp8474_c0_seq14:479-1297(+)
MQDQLQYSLQVMDYLNASLYKPHLPSPRDPILIGHSMGGILAQKIAIKFYEANKRRLHVITLATPKVIGNNHAGEKHFMHLTSFNGGSRDITVPEFVTGTSIATSQILDVLLPTDHKCILWCSEFVTKLAAAIASYFKEGKVSKSTNGENSQQDPFLLQFLPFPLQTTDTLGKSNQFEEFSSTRDTSSRNIAIPLQSNGPLNILFNMSQISTRKLQASYCRRTAKNTYTIADTETVNHEQLIYACVPHQQHNCHLSTYCLNNHKRLSPSILP